ncbi:MAG TPA: DUF927 domain-containing protein, partial [Armatimonadota bacterium]|nr:DUF927 domain-containing protein [Armatimonadota bacterium]
LAMDTTAGERERQSLEPLLATPAARGALVSGKMLAAVLLGLASMLLEFSGIESGGINLKGSSSTGKTTALAAAASLFGGPSYVNRWRATSNGLESLAALHNDTLLILDELAQVDPREAGEIALISAERMKHLIDALLDISRMEGDRMPIHLADLNPCQLADGALNQVSLWARNARVSLARDYHPDAKPVRADRALAERVLVNLLGNALRHSPPETVITLRVANVAGGVAFSISDQGPGIPAEWLSRIFDKFTQVAARKSGAAVGTGLGLTFCRHAVEAQGGRIGIESQEGKGTTVTVTFPAAPASQADPMEGALMAGGR